MWLAIVLLTVERMGTYKLVKARFWPWLEPFSVLFSSIINLQPLKVINY